LIFLWIIKEIQGVTNSKQLTPRCKRGVGTAMVIFVIAKDCEGEKGYVYVHIEI